VDIRESSSEAGSCGRTSMNTKAYNGVQLWLQRDCYKSVVRIRLVKTEKKRVLVICAVDRLAIALKLILIKRDCKRKC
jgi:hypothetical protein